MEDKTIIALLNERDEAGIEVLRRKYESYCLSVAKNILPCREDAEEVVSDIWLRVWNAIPPEHPENLRLYVARIARNLALDRYRQLHRQSRGGGQTALALEELAECIPAKNDLETQMNTRELTGAINRFLAGISQRDRNIFLRRYFHMESSAAIALRYGLRESSVRTVLSRTRKRLKTYLNKEGYL